jgi:hypothetical protein
MRAFAFLFLYLSRNEQHYVKPLLSQQLIKGQVVSSLSKANSEIRATELPQTILPVASHSFGQSSFPYFHSNFWPLRTFSRLPYLQAESLQGSQSYPTMAD